LSILPVVLVYGRCTPAERTLFLSNPVSSTMDTPAGVLELVQDVSAQVIAHPGCAQ
jgi:hypothetical protein